MSDIKASSLIHALRAALLENGFDPKLAPYLDALSRKMGTPGELQKSLLDLAGKGELTAGDLLRLMRQAGYDKDIVALVERLLAGSEDESRPSTRDLVGLLDKADKPLVALQRARSGKASKKSLQAAILALLQQNEPNELQKSLIDVATRGDLPAKELPRLMRQAGHDKDIVALVEKLLRHQDGVKGQPTTRELVNLLDTIDMSALNAQRALKNADSEAALATAARQVLTRDGKTLTKKQAGLNRRLLRMVRDGKVTRQDMLALARRSGYSTNQAMALDALLDRFDEFTGERGKGISARHLHRVLTEIDPALIDLLKAKTGKSDADAARALYAVLLKHYGQGLTEKYPALQSQLLSIAIEGELRPDDIAILMRKAGYLPRQVALVQQTLASSADDDGDDDDSILTPDQAGQLLRRAGYPTRFITSVKSLLTQAQSDDVLNGEDIARSLRHTGQSEKILSAVGALLARNGSDDPLAPADIVHLVRKAGYPPPVLSVLERLLARFALGDADGADGPSATQLATLMDQADPALIELQKARRGKTPEDVLRAAMAVLLKQYGADPKAAGDLAIAVQRLQDEDSLREFARIGRAARSAEDSCVSIADVSWKSEDRYADAYETARGISAWGREINWRVQTLIKMAKLASGKPGDFVECGVDTGGTAMAVMSYLGDAAFRDRRFYLFDTFQGLDQSQLTDEEKTTSLIKDSRYPNVLERVKDTFKGKPFTRIVPGSVPDTLDAFDEGPVAYLHIDMNVTLPEVEALRFFWPRLSPGAPVIFDDYGFPHHTPQREALDAVAREFGQEIMMLPTCQGLLFKS